MSKTKDKPAATNMKILQVTVTAVRTKAVCEVVFADWRRGVGEKNLLPALTAP